MSFFIQSAYAVDATPAGPSMMGNLLMMAFFVVIFYFMIWRPQSKRQKEHKSMLDSLKEGSEVIFAGGLMGTITNLSTDYAVVDLNTKNEVTIQKSAIIAVLPEGTIVGVKNS